MPVWLSVVAGAVLPRLEQAYLPGYTHRMSVSAALAFFSAVSSGMMALTGIVFAIAFVAVQFSALAYSPGLVVMFADSPPIYHALGVFFATFTYSLAALIWTDRGGSGTVPFFSALLVTILLIVSMLAFARLIRSVNNLQVHNVLQVIGTRVRSVICAMLPRLQQGANGTVSTEIEVQEILARQPRQSAIPANRARSQDTISIPWHDWRRPMPSSPSKCGVGETLVEGAVVFRVHGASLPLPEQALMRAIRLSTSRTLEQDPKYAIRLLVDVAIRALSPAVNDPTTAVQAIDQIEDLLRRLSRGQLDAGYARGPSGTIRVVFPVPGWPDYLALSFDEIRQFGATSVQFVRRLRAALVGLADATTVINRHDAVLAYLDHLNRSVARSGFDDLDQAAALQEDRQGLGLPRKKHDRQVRSPDKTEAA
ncbi:MAG TPA: DUF2254 family protein [Acetobacteraceae bacterium]|jgi:uncharacterized membrane protein